MTWLITPQTKVPVDPQYGSVSLLLHGNGTNGSTTITDNSPSPKTVTAFGDAKISTATADPFGSNTRGVLAFDGNFDYLQTANNAAFQFGSVNFTIEYWIYPSSLSGVRQHINPDDANNTSYAIITNGTALLYYLSSNGGTAWNIASGVSIGTAVLNAWQHVALVRNGNTFTPYLNGVAGTATTSSTALFNFTSLVTIGSSSLLANFYQGYMSQFRITKSVARYTANFTPPTAPFPDL